MPTYSAKITIEKGILKDLTSNGYSLCMSNAVGDVMNVATIAMPPKGDQAYGPNNELTWTVNYFVAGNAKPWEQGGVVAKVSTDVLGIDIGQCFDLFSDSWNDAQIDASCTPSKNAFGFKTAELKAAPVVYIENTTSSTGMGDLLMADMAPIYISPFLLLPPGSASLTPQPKFAIYFLQTVKTSSMISISDAYLLKEVNLNNFGPNVCMTLTDKRSWAVTKCPVGRPRK
jgi:hypothetical protein